MKILVAFATLLLCSCGLFTTNSQAPTLASKDAWLTSSNILSLATTSQLGAGDTAIAMILNPAIKKECVVYTGLGIRCISHDSLNTFGISHGSRLIYLANNQQQIILDARTFDTLMMRKQDSVFTDTASLRLSDIAMLSPRFFLLNESTGNLTILNSANDSIIRNQVITSSSSTRTWSRSWLGISGNICVEEGLWTNTKLSASGTLCVDSLGRVDTLPFAAGQPDSVRDNTVLFLQGWAGKIWNLLVTRDGGVNSEGYYRVHLALTSMALDGSLFIVNSATEHSDITFFTPRLIANDALGAYVILAENYPTGEGTGALLTIYRADSKNELQQIKRYHVDGISLGIKTAWAVDANHFAVVLNNSFWNDGADNIMLFDKNGNVVKGL